LWAVYALELEDGCFYVGMTSQLKHRLRKHFAGQGASFTRLHRPLAVLELHQAATESEAKSMEKELTTSLKALHGHASVRGYGHTAA
jgi:predicted GIY-YIG superfamily endonuclease